MKKNFFLLLIFLIGSFEISYGYTTAEALIDNLSKGGKMICENKNNVILQITNKIEANTIQEVTRVGAVLAIDNLEINPLRCCVGQSGESYVFAKIYNTKLKKEIFNAWLFSRHTSLTGIEDVKFDVILLKCF
jgi:hypothetical protein